MLAFPWIRLTALALAVSALAASTLLKAQSFDGRHLATGNSHSVFLRSDGTVWTVGIGYLGQLGTGLTEHTIPTQVAPLTNVTAVAAGQDFTLTLKSDGTLWTFGGNEYGQLGDGTTTNRYTPVQVSGLSGIVASSAGQYHTVALKDDGTVWTFGRNLNGQLGDGTWTTRKTPVQVNGLSGIVAVSAGAHHSAVVKSDGTVWTFGSNQFGQFGNGTTTSSNTPVQVASLSNVTAVALGTDHSLALRNDGSVWAFGNNGHGQLGDGTTTTRLTPVQVSSLSNVTAIAAGSSHSLALQNDGVVWAFGINLGGQLGDGTLLYRTTPTQSSIPSNVMAITAGIGSSIAVSTDGVLWTFGSNSWGRLGHGYTSGSHEPTQISRLHDAVDMSAGNGTSLVLRNDRTLWGFGSNTDGQLGGGTNGDHSSPKLVSGLSDVTKVASGGIHAIALKFDGTVWTFGHNYFGQLGLNVLSTSTPTQIASLSDVTNIAAGLLHTVVVRSNGTLWAFGNNDFGQLGDETTVSRFAPALVSGLSAVYSVDAGFFHTAVLRDDGTVWTFGYNYYGQLGDGTATNRHHPVQVNGLNDVIAVSAGSSHTAVLRTDGTVWTFGGNTSGQLGDGTNTNRLQPVQAIGLNDIVAIDTGEYFTVALKSDGTVWTFGDNGHGQLGDGSATSSSVPAPVPGLTGVVGLAAGYTHVLTLKEDGTVSAWGAGRSGQLSELDESANISIPRALIGYNLQHASPEAFIVSPASPVTIQLGSTQTLSASMNGGSNVADTAFLYHHGLLLDQSTNAPFTFNFTPWTWGQFDLTVILADSNGAYSPRSQKLTVVVPYDSDANNLPDWWELMYLGGLGNDPDADPDGDGSSNLDEYINGTNPNDPASTPASEDDPEPQPIALVVNAFHIVGTQHEEYNQSQPPVLYITHDLKSNLREIEGEEGSLVTDSMRNFGFDDEDTDALTFTQSAPFMDYLEAHLAASSSGCPICGRKATWSKLALTGITNAERQLPLSFEFIIRLSTVKTSYPTSVNTDWGILKIDFTRGGGTPIVRIIAGEAIKSMLRYDGAIYCEPPIVDNFLFDLSFHSVSLWDIKDVNNTLDNQLVADWNTTQNIAHSNIAYIEPHNSATDAVPRMPKLQFGTPGLGNGMTIEAKLEVRYDRGNGERTARNQDEDIIRVPVNGEFKQLNSNNSTWNIFNDPDWQTEIDERGFFGGEANLTYRLLDEQNEVLTTRTTRFRIGGKNPVPARAREFVEDQENAGPLDPLWFAYAIAKTESKDYNGMGTRYNQFYQLPRDVGDTHLRVKRRIHAGRPVWGNDGGTTPGGYGMFQVTGTAASKVANIPRRQIWNWQDNSRAALVILESKRTDAENWMTQQKNANNANGVVLPSLTVHSVTFADGTSRTMNHAVTMKAWNGANRPAEGFTDPGPVPPGFILDPHASGHFCFWKNSASGTNKWALSRYNSYNPPFNFVDRVCQEVE